MENTDFDPKLQIQTLQQAVGYLLPRFKGMEKYFKQYSEDDFAAFCHSQRSGGIGMKIRNELGLWTKDSALYDVLKKQVDDCDDADAMSDIILRHVYRSYHKDNEEQRKRH